MPGFLSAAAPEELKRHAFEGIDENADQLALLGDSLFYFGELGMQEFESTKLIKETLERGGFAVEMGGGRHADGSLGPVGHATAPHPHRHRGRCAS